jgi:NAD(P)-dependent dehydrogenase (short-subunit alcohol dehydrogenase family)
MSDSNLEGKVVVVTGASSGFGKGAALEFAKAGARVVLAARRENLLDELVRECESAGATALAVKADVGVEEDVARIAETVQQDLGRIDVWVNNAGVGAVGPFNEVPLEDHRKVIETDLLGTVYGSYFALRRFREQGWGTLINVASLLGKVPAPHYTSYVAAKHGVVGLSAALRQELAEENFDRIHVCTVLPTSTDTPFFQHAANYSGREVRPIPPTYDPRQVIEAIVSLAVEPRDEITVGGAGKVTAAAHTISRTLTERMLGKQTLAAAKTAPPAEETAGNLHEPSESGTGVRGGWRQS